MALSNTQTEPTTSMGWAQEGAASCCVWHSQQSSLPWGDMHGPRQKNQAADRAWDQPWRRCSSVTTELFKSELTEIPDLRCPIPAGDHYLSGSWSSPYFSSRNLNPTSQKVVVNWHTASSWANSSAITEHFSHLCSLTMPACPLLEPRPSWDSEDLNIRFTERWNSQAPEFSCQIDSSNRTEIAQRWQHSHLVLEWDQPPVCWATQKWWYPLKMTMTETGSQQLVCVAASFEENLFFEQRIEERSQEIQWIL